MSENEEEEGNAAFGKVFDCQEALQDLIDGGGEKDDDPATSLAAIKNAGQGLLDAINDLSLADFEEEFPEVDETNEEDTWEQLFQ